MDYIHATRARHMIFGFLDEDGNLCFFNVLCKPPVCGLPQKASLQQTTNPYSDVHLCSLQVASKANANYDMPSHCVQPAGLDFTALQGNAAG